MAFWNKFNGNYEKLFYDIQIKNRDKTWECEYEVIEHCWPNAGKFHTPDGEVIDGKFIFYIRESKNQGG